MSSIVTRRIVMDTASLRRWLRSAVAGEQKIYHAGLLAHDRNLYPELNSLADTIMVLQETGYVAASQYRQQLPMDSLWVYLVARTGKGYAPSGVMSGKLPARDFIALQAVLHREPSMSATRVVRDACGLNDDEAAKVLADLRERGLIEDAPGKGITITKAAIALMT